jgi:hypothetical protein
MRPALMSGLGSTIKHLERMEEDATKVQRRRVNTPGHVTRQQGFKRRIRHLLLASRVTRPIKSELLKGDDSTVAWSPRMSNQRG